MKRPGIVGIVVVLLLAGCARPGMHHASPTPSVAPTTVLARCVFTPGPASPGPTATGRRPKPPARVSPPARVTPPAPDPSRSLTVDEQWGQRQAENNAFRQRRPLSPAARAAGIGYADAVCTGLARLRTSGNYDPTAIRQVLAEAALTEVQVRPPGRLDLAGSGGLLFAGWTGQACVFGEHGTATTEVDLGSQIADGGCLPAAD